jgi:hypothetical protein
VGVVAAAIGLPSRSGPLMILSNVPLHWDSKCRESVVARVNFPHEGTRGLYRTLEELSKKLSSFSSGNPAKQSPCLASPTPPSGCQAQGVECK